MPEHVEAVLARQEEAAKAAMVSQTQNTATIDVKALQAAEKTARQDAAAVSSEIDTINERMADLIANQRRRKHSPWRRWFSDNDVSAALGRLREHRERLRASHAVLAQARLRAEIAVKNGANECVRLNAKAAQERQAAQGLAEKQLAILARVKAILARVPALAYVGARNLLRMATRIERACEHGWDPGPDHWVQNPTESKP